MSTKVLWLVFILANAYDVLVSFIGWHYPYVIELNPIINSFRADGYVSMLEVLVGLKLMMISAVYYITERVRRKGLVLAVAVATILSAVVWDTFVLFEAL